MEKLKYLFGSLTVILLMTITVYGGFRLAFRRLIIPKVNIAGVDMTGMDKPTAQKLINSYFENNPSKISLESDGKIISKLTGIKVEQDLIWAVDQAMSVGRNGNVLTQMMEGSRVLLHGRTIDVPVSYDKDDILGLVEQISEKLNQKPTWPELRKENEKYKLVPGKNGIEVKQNDLIGEIIMQFGRPGSHVIQIPTSLVETKENGEMVKTAIQSLEKWGNNKLSIRFRDFERQLNVDEISHLFGLINEQIDNSKFESLVSEIETAVEVEPRDAVFVFENNKVQLKFSFRDKKEFESLVQKMNTALLQPELEDILKDL